MEYVRHHRSLNAVIRAANKLDLYKPQKEWTLEEDALLKTFYLVEGEQSFKRLTERSVSSCRARVLRLGLIRRSEWTQEELNILITNYPEQGPACFSLIPTKSIEACKARVQKLKLKRLIRPTGALWTEEENEILKQFYPVEGCSVDSRLPGRSKATIKRQARKLNIKYTGPKKHTGQKQVRCIDTGIIYTSTKAAAQALNISYKSIQANASGTTKSGGGYHWEYID